MNEGNEEWEIDGARQEPRMVTVRRTGRARLLPSRDSSCNQWFCLPLCALGVLGGEPGLEIGSAVAAAADQGAGESFVARCKWASRGRKETKGGLGGTAGVLAQCH